MKKYFLTQKTKKIISYILYVHRSRPQDLKQHFILWSGNQRERRKTYASQESCEESTCEEGREEGCQEEITELGRAPAGPRQSILGLIDRGVGDHPYFIA
jgi:hypothetical protein